LVSFRFFLRLYLCMVKYLSFHNFSFALRYFLMWIARPQCDTPLVSLSSKHYLLEFATSVMVVMLFLCSSLYQCHAWSLIFLNLLQVLMVIMFFMFKLTSMSCSKSYVFEFVTSVNSHHVVFMFKFTSMSCLKLHFLEFVTSVHGCHFFLCSSLHQCYARNLISFNLLQVLMVVMCLNSLQCHSNNASICHAWCYDIV
jgi:hypothetical protein